MESLSKSLVSQVLALAALLVIGVGCGSSDPEPAAGTVAVSKKAVKTAAAPKAAQNTPPVIDDIRFEPEVPVPGRPIRALVHATDADGDGLWFEYDWSIDGREVGEKGQGQDLDLSAATKGQRVDLVVVASDGKDQSEPYDMRFELENRPPEIVGINVEPGREVVSGTPVVAFPSGSDPDGDPITYRYAWTVNGRELREEGALLETQRMRRGDEIRVRVVADDGEVESAAVEMPPIVIVNGPPRVVSFPPSDLSNGVFRYAVSAQDPDGDPHIEFRLEGAPSGMKIDPYSGLITWSPSAEQAGVHSVTVFAEDMHDGTGQQEFEVRVTAPEEDASPAEAAP